jgi:hypothetical protein
MCNAVINLGHVSQGVILFLIYVHITLDFVKKKD